MQIFSKEHSNLMYIKFCINYYHWPMTIFWFCYQDDFPIKLGGTKLIPNKNEINLNLLNLTID